MQFFLYLCLIMFHCFLKSKKVIEDTITRKFNFYLVEWRARYLTTDDKDKLYLKAFQEMLTLQEYALWPLGAAESFSELTKLHIGKTSDEIEALSMKLAKYNVMIKNGIEFGESLTEEELVAVTEYHKYLFATTIKIENPFNY